jgi:hypothetical protein
MNRSFDRYFKKNQILLNESVLFEQELKIDVAKIVEDEVGKVLSSGASPEARESIVQKVLQTLANEDSIASIIQTTLGAAEEDPR